VAERVDEGGDTAVGLVPRRALDDGAAVGSTPDAVVDVVDLEVQRVAVRLPGDRWLHAALRPRIRDHQHGIPERQLGVADRPVRTLVQPTS
jgi:hypothetical protein